jgi:hypothetical protein
MVFDRMCDDFCPAAVWHHWQYLSEISCEEYRLAPEDVIDFCELSQ